MKTWVPPVFLALAVLSAPERAATQANAPQGHAVAQMFERTDAPGVYILVFSDHVLKTIPEKNVKKTLEFKNAGYDGVRWSGLFLGKSSHAGVEFHELSHVTGWENPPAVTYVLFNRAKEENYSLRLHYVDKTNAADSLALKCGEVEREFRLIDDVTAPAGLEAFLDLVQKKKYRLIPDSAASKFDPCAEEHGNNAPKTPLPSAHALPSAKQAHEWTVQSRGIDPDVPVLPQDGQPAGKGPRNVNVSPPRNRKTLMAATARKGLAWLGPREDALKKLYDAEYERRFQALVARGVPEEKATNQVADQISPLAPNVLAWDLGDYATSSSDEKRAMLLRLRRVMDLPGVLDGAALRAAKEAWNSYVSDNRRGLGMAMDGSTYAAEELGLDPARFPGELKRERVDGKVGVSFKDAGGKTGFQPIDE